MAGSGGTSIGGVTFLDLFGDVYVRAMRSAAFGSIDYNTKEGVGDMFALSLFLTPS